MRMFLDLLKIRGDFLTSIKFVMDKNFNFDLEIRISKLNYS